MILTSTSPYCINSNGHYYVTLLHDYAVVLAALLRLFVLMITRTNVAVEAFEYAAVMKQNQMKCTEVALLHHVPSLIIAPHSVVLLCFQVVFVGNCRVKAFMLLLLMMKIVNH